jgi:Na+/pantothenate symporter
MKNKILFILILVLSLYQSFALIGSLFSNGLFVFNLERNDTGIQNIFVVINLIIAIILLIFLANDKNKAKWINHLYFGSWLIVFLMPYITYYLKLPSNDYLRMGGIVIIPLIIIAWIWAAKSLKV